MKKAPVIFLFSLFFFTSNAQKQRRKEKEWFTTKPDTLFVVKVRCNDDFIGYKLCIAESNFFREEKFRWDFSYNFLWEASSQQKIFLIKQLLQFENDSSLSCSRVYSYSNSAKKYLEKIKSVNYSLQIAALYHINMICFAQNAPFKYAPFPVLYDTISKCEINGDFKKVKEVFAIYKNWFEQNCQTNFSNYYFPLLNTRYKWTFGKNDSDLNFYNFPVIRSDYKKKVGVRH